ncbi:peptidylprolyl isomerase [Granulosicoccus antarcticus]|uniref:Peptidyl-prolyl cis-trans isomerase n=1 Tax=Granulosicoccus antarcticus IMCC3135 TaxID=1192854 RepID=A0A2Z2P1T6_9GAMM|nr:peptidylprolyl isomerase [Granulosicoccus antarcticus]ASJ74447.1 Peptidyl-prolyl cis-trans isomerase cyp18 [Granulosicoccus antarcticus IMCC3135]
MPSFTVVTTALAEVISTALNRLPQASTALLALLATLLTPQSALAASGTRVMLDTTQGPIVLELDDKRAPQSVKNFLEYVDSGFYDDTLFHRVIEGFMIQGGGFNQKYQKKPTRSPVSNEAYNGLRNRHYTIAMARTTAPHSATSQFFINSEDNSNLNHTDTTQRGWGYAVFGRVVEGQDVVDAISRVRTGAGGPFSRDVPTEPVIILSASRVQQSDTAAAAQADNNNLSGSGKTSSTPEQELPKSTTAPGNTPLPAATPAADNVADNNPQQPIEQN